MHVQYIIHIYICRVHWIYEIEIIIWEIKCFYYKNELNSQRIWYTCLHLFSKTLFNKIALNFNDCFNVTSKVTAYWNHVIIIHVRHNFRNVNLSMTPGYWKADFGALSEWSLIQSREINPKSWEIMIMKMFGHPL